MTPLNLLTSYPIAQDRYDEMFDPASQVRPHWQTMLSYLQNETVESMQERLYSVQRQVYENGVTYNVYADPKVKAKQKSWDLNLLPFILPHEEWEHIEAAVIQRANLINQILNDVYGEQKMLQEGLLPAALVHGHPSFLRPCHGIKKTDDIALHFYAVDLARAPNGQWWVVADRTQTPSGAAYALENRNIISRALPEIFQDLKIESLDSFFTTFRDSLSHWGRICATQYGNGRSDDFTLSANEAPLIVLLTPGPHHGAYYEQSYLARTLGYPLVEGKDLTVRNGMVWMKTLGGPQRVHVILRRVDDSFCDPLELNSESMLGVVGLVEAARRGAVLIANSLGSGLLESGAILGFLPNLSQRLLGAPLKMPSVATWWCGEPAALEDVIQRLDQLVIKSVFPHSRESQVFGQDLIGAERVKLIDKLRATPQNYIAQELVHLSQAPIWQSNTTQNSHSIGLSASAIGLCVYACATPNGYVVMPGGLTRVATGADTRVITIQQGGSSKDTWVQSKSANYHYQSDVQIDRNVDISVINSSSIAQKKHAHTVVRSDTHLSSRLVENLFWFGRYSERCANVSRLMRTTLDFLLKVSPEHRGAEWPTMQTLCRYFDLIKGNIQSVDKPEWEVLHSSFASKNWGLSSNLQQLHAISSSLRERLSLDNWRTLNQLVHRVHAIQTVHAGQVKRSRKSSNLAETIRFLDEIINTLMTLSGFALDGMTRDHGWIFLAIGRHLERLQFLCTVLQHAMRLPADSTLDWLLEMMDSIVTYRSRYMARPEWPLVMDLLIFDENNPRSVVFQLQALLKSLEHLSLQYGPCGANIFLPLLSQLHAIESDHDLHFGNEPLQQLLTKLNTASYSLSDHINLRFFSYSGDVNYNSFIE